MARKYTRKTILLLPILEESKCKSIIKNMTSMMKLFSRQKKSHLPILILMRTKRRSHIGLLKHPTHLGISKRFIRLNSIRNLKRI